MPQTNSLIRTVHDLGLAGWFGGALMGAAGVNKAAAEAGSTDESMRFANATWQNWSPINAAAIGAHLVGAAGMTIANRDRMRHQKGVLPLAITKAVLTAGALGMSAYARRLGAQIESADDPDDREIIETRQRLSQIQWAVPALTGAMLVIGARMSEQQRPRAVADGVVRRLLRR